MPQRSLAGPARDVIKSVKNLHQATDLLNQLRVVGARIDDMYRTIDPEQHAFLVRVRERLEDAHPPYKALGTLDPTIFHGRSCIFNRQTPEHRDRKDPKRNLTPILTFGEYDWGVLRVRELGLDVDYGPGTLVMLRGGLLTHGVTYDGGQRVSIAHFMHDYMLREAGLGEPPLTRAKDPGAVAGNRSRERVDVGK